MRVEVQDVFRLAVSGVDQSFGLFVAVGGNAAALDFVKG